MTRPVYWAVHVAEHDGGRGLQAQRVGGSHYLQPLCRIQFVRAQDLAHLVIENFRRSARQGAQAGLFQFRQVGWQRHTQGFCPLPDFQR